MGDDQIGLCFLGALDQQPCRIRIQPVIAVYKLEIGSVGAFNGEIARSRYTAVLFVDNAKSGVALGVHAADVQAGIAAAVVDQKNFNILIALPPNTFNTSGEVGRGIVHRNNDADKRGGGVQGDSAPLRKFPNEYGYIAVTLL